MNQNYLEKPSRVKGKARKAFTDKIRHVKVHDVKTNSQYRAGAKEHLRRLVTNGDYE